MDVVHHTNRNVALKEVRCGENRTEEGRLEAYHEGIVARTWIELEIVCEEGRVAFVRRVWLKTDRRRGATHPHDGSLKWNSLTADRLLCSNSEDDNQEVDGSKKGMKFPKSEDRSKNLVMNLDARIPFEKLRRRLS
ncbi:hypothetical protein GCK32_004743 [Trichostrongylus colubriformis]|uniref:Uncharacterized protein n=1 Tax=Trichostrongylus colubriformis TaxID=6319 RepID=A0AAN8IQ17_TRICO